MSEILKEKLERIFFECDMHLKRMNSAAKRMVSIMPLSKEKYECLNEDEIEHIDQFLFRFMKLQDAMGQKLFKTILEFLGEEVEGRPFIDILNQMEKLSLIDSRLTWQELREDRNELAHNYENNPKNMALAINKIFEKRGVIERIYQKIKTHYQNNLQKGV